MSNETHLHHHRVASAPSSPRSLLFVRGHVALTISRSDSNVSSVYGDHVIEIPSPCLFRDGTRIPLVRYNNSIERGNQQTQDQNPHVLSAYHLRVTLSFSGADCIVGEAGAIPFVWCLVKLSLPAASPTALHSSQPQVFSKTFLLPTSNLTSIGGALTRVEAEVNGGVVRDHVSVVAKCLDISDLVRHAHHWLGNLALCLPSIEQQRAEAWRLTMCVFVPTLEVIHAMVSSVTTTCALDRMMMERPMLESLGLRWINGEAPSQLEDHIADLMPLRSGGGDAVSTFLGCRPGVRFQHAVAAAARAVESSNRKQHHNYSSNLQKRARDGTDEVSSTIPVATAKHLRDWDLVGVARLHIMFEFSSINIVL